MCRILLKTVGATAACSLALAAGTASGAGAGGVMPQGWTHAEINYSVARVPHTLILDRGRIMAFTSSSLTLREQDGTVAQIALSPSTQVTTNNQPGQLSDVRRFAFAMAERIDGGPATQLRLTIPPRLR